MNYTTPILAGITLLAPCAVSAGYPNNYVFSENESITAITLAATRVDLDPVLLKAICFTESSFKASAINPKDRGGASLGLCQIKLATARLEGYKGTFRGLLNPYVNAYYSGKYLKHQIRRYKGNKTRAVAAYNAGSAGIVIRNTKYVNKVAKAYKDFK